ncbi:hypothetical protein MRY82_06175 [bacterium]|nr:hypothetical protein [bacterium]
MCLKNISIQQCVQSGPAQIKPDFSERSEKEEIIEKTSGNDGLYLSLSESDLTVDLWRFAQGSFMMDIADAKYELGLLGYALLAISKDDEVMNEVVDIFLKLSVQPPHHVIFYTIRKKKT